MGRAYPVTNWAEISFLEDALFHEFHGRSALMNGKVPRPPKTGRRHRNHPKEFRWRWTLKSRRRGPALRLPPQAEHYSQIVSQSLRSRTREKSRELSRPTSSGSRSASGSFLG